ncbi:MAG: flagellar transcriptional regulator FlhC [Betaproteobacteria bacterium]|nr:flagellar transcriptional regulator FlhC [Betaproteobacteria bacterium]
MRNKSVITEAEEIGLATELVKLGARLQLLETETQLSRERLLKLYKEIRGESPPKGMLPFSADWFVTWQPNIHASLFIDILDYLTENTKLKGIRAIIKAYKLYLENARVSDLEPILSVTRAWTLVRFIDGGLLRTTACTRCGGDFVVHAHDLYDHYVCGLCRPPSRAGKGGRPEAARVATEALAIVG